MDIACNVYLSEVLILSLQQKLKAALPTEVIEFKHILPHEYLCNVQADILVYPANPKSATNYTGVAVVGTNYANNCAIFPDGLIDVADVTIVYYFYDIDIEAVHLCLNKALPQPVNTSFQFIKKDIGDFSTLYAENINSAFILPAGFLQQYHIYDIHMAGMLKCSKQMVLPLLDCPPASFSSFIIAEPQNNDAKTLKAVKALNNHYLFQQLQQEEVLYKKLFAEKEHVFTQTIFVSDVESFRYAVYTDTNNKKVEVWEPLPALPRDKKLFSATEFMGSFFNISPLPYQLSKAAVVYIANYKAIHSLNEWQHKTVWASGSKTWFEAAKKGIWVSGCADAFGLEYLEKIWCLPLHGIDKKEVQLLTNNTGAKIWQQKGWEAIACYELAEQENEMLFEAVSRAEVFFWTSVQQYKAVEKYIPPDAVHYCPYGETTQQFKKTGVVVIALPNIKAFKIWSKNIL